MSDKPSSQTPEDLDSRRVEQLNRIAAWTEQERPAPEPETPGSDADSVEAA